MGKLTLNYLNPFLAIYNFLCQLYYIQATPRLSEDKVKQCVDPKLKGEYPPKAVAKVTNSFYTSTVITLLEANMRVGVLMVNNSLRRLQRCVCNTNQSLGQT